MTLERMISLFGDDRVVMGEICSIFLQEARTATAQLEALLESGELKAAKKVAHTIKGSAGNIGADEVAALAFDIEKVILADDADGALILLSALQDAVEETAGFLHAELGI
jgi:HPt (histidine-containing phosphotransfer) domain-containing protein